MGLIFVFLFFQLQFSVVIEIVCKDLGTLKSCFGTMQILKIRLKGVRTKPFLLL